MNQKIIKWTIVLSVIVLAIFPTSILGAGKTSTQSSSKTITNKKVTENFIALSWLGNKKPVIPTGVSFGVPWQRGALKDIKTIALLDSNAQVIPAQVWPLAYWPDGSLKWTGIAFAAGRDNSGLKLSIKKGKNQLPVSPVSVKENSDDVEVNTGAITAIISRKGDAIIKSLKTGNKTIAHEGRLIAIREDRSAYTDQKIIREIEYISKIKELTVEQSGPVRAVIRIEGMHAEVKGARQWLPFVVRLYFTAGLSSVKMVHSFVFDGDQSTDFIKGLGLSFAVPFREELQNRHIRFATDNSNIFSEPVLMTPGFLSRRTNEELERQKAQLAGQRIPDLSDVAPNEKENLQGMPVWDDFRIDQLSSDGWELYKRTNPSSSWLHITNGNRARGLGFLGDVSGGLAIGMKRFWQKYPVSFEINNATKDTGSISVWFWSPKSQPMDMRHYDTLAHSADVTYEDSRTIPMKRADACGVANTTELTLWITSNTPSALELNSMTNNANCPPLVVCAPDYYQQTKACGFWTLPSTPVPGLNDSDMVKAEDFLKKAFLFYQGEVERRKWYGFWDFGDYRRTYDPTRRQWMYDIGGHGWNASELVPNIWLWFAFFRSGDADIFHAAEDMTRNNSEVDVYHLGRFAGVGTRHGVTHWGDGAKEPRISEAYLKRFYYYLTTDERTGDLMRQPLAVLDSTMMYLEGKGNGRYSARVGPDWQAYVSNWLTEWERTGDTKYRDYCLTGMNDLANMSEQALLANSFLLDPVTKHLYPSGRKNSLLTQFLFLFAGDQIFSDLSLLIPHPKFEYTWNRWCQLIVETNQVNHYYKPRILAKLAGFTGDKKVQEQAIQAYRDLLKCSDTNYFIGDLHLIDDPSVTQRVLDTSKSCNTGKNFATPEVAQWALNLMTTTVLFQQFKAKEQLTKIKE